MGRFRGCSVDQLTHKRQGYDVVTLARWTPFFDN
jgi:hypothetical protein